MEGETVKTFKEAAEELGVSYTTIDRRVSLLGMRTEHDEDGRRLVDVRELDRLWRARQDEKEQTPRDEAFLSVTVRREQRERIDSLAQTLRVSRAAVVRRLLDIGWTAYIETK